MAAQRFRDANTLEEGDSPACILYREPADMGHSPTPAWGPSACDSEAVVLGWGWKKQKGFLGREVCTPPFLSASDVTWLVQGGGAGVCPRQGGCAPEAGPESVSDSGAVNKASPRGAAPRSFRQGHMS